MSANPSFEPSAGSVVSRIVNESCMHQPSLMPEGPWWKYLESNFSEREEGFELDLRDSLMVKSTAAMDVVSRTVSSTLIGLTCFAPGFNPVTLAKALEDRPLYEMLADSGDPNRFFRPPPKDVRVKSKRAGWYLFNPVDGGKVLDLSWESTYEPLNPRIRKDYLSHRNNRTVTARCWRHRGGPRPTIIAVHGFMADAMWINEWFFALPWFYRMGCDVALLTLPFHGSRQANFSLYPGHGFFIGGLSWINEAFGQAIMDLRVFMDHLTEIGVEQIGQTGVSLGGYTTALLATVEPRLKFAIPNVPVVSIADLILEWFPTGTAARAAMFLTRKSVKEVRHALAVHTPLTYKPVLPKERLMIVGGVGDRLAPPKHSRLLWDHWGRPRIHWFPGNHILHLDKGDYLKQQAIFLSEIGFLPAERGRT